MQDAAEASYRVVVQSMQWRRDVLLGLLSFALGAATLFYALGNYSTGTIARIGPALFPALIGSFLCVLGLAQVATAVLSGRAAAEAGPGVAWRPICCILLSVLGFAFIVDKFGLIPAAAAAVVIAGFGNPALSLAQKGALAAVLSIGAWLVFSVGLGLNLPAFKV